MKSLIPNAFLMFAVVMAAFWQMARWPQRVFREPVTIALGAEPVVLPDAAGPLRVAGAWNLSADDPRLFGLSGLAFEGDGFAAVGDNGSGMRFDRPGTGARIWLADLRTGPGRFGAKFTRDAESVLADGAGWLVGFEQRHSVWRFDRDFRNGREVVSLRGRGWPDNRGAEGLSRIGNMVIVWREGGQEALAIGTGSPRSMPLASNWSIAEAALGPDGGTWLLLRLIDWSGVRQAIASARPTGRGWSLGPAMPVAKGPLDNFEGMAIERSARGGLRFWLVSDDGSRVFARTLLAAYDLPPTKTNARR